MTRLSLAAVIAFSATAATAQTCGPTKKFVESFVKAHGEKPVVQLTQPSGAFLLVLINPEKGNWSVINVRPNGMSCLMGAGNGYVSKLGKPGEDS